MVKLFTFEIFKLAWYAMALINNKLSLNYKTWKNVFSTYNHYRKIG